MKKHKTLSILLVIVLVTASMLCGTVLAYMFRKTEFADNTFTPAEVSCVVHEETDSPLTEKSGITVQNTGTIDAYLRVRFVSYWVDSEGTIVAKPSSMPTINIAEGWLAGKNDTYYCQSPVAPGNFTDELLSSPILLAKDTENDYLQVVEVFAEAIQGKPATAVTDSWGVSLDSNGNITSAP